MGSQILPSEPQKLRVAIVGAGPAGLGAAIALSAISNVEVTVYEKAKILREIGAGIRIGYNCWKVLELLGAADRVTGHLKTSVKFRNGLNGTIINGTGESSLPRRYWPRRVKRTRLQSGLVSMVPEGIIQLGKGVSSIENIENGGVKVLFQDGTNTTADLVVGADGIRSVVRESIFPDHTTNFTRTTIWRTLIPIASVKDIGPEIYAATSWWAGPAGHVYFSPVDDVNELPEEERSFEISCRNLVDPSTVTEKRFSWGIPATNERVTSHFTEYDARVREALSRVPEGNWKEFSAFAGPRLNKLHAWDKVVLLGDASHPLSGAFGSGAAFALEDGWILARAIEHTRNSPKALSKAIEIFDTIRSPYYARMYQYLDDQKQKITEQLAATTNKSFEEELKIKIGSFGGEATLPWIYHNDIEKVWDTYKSLGHQSNGGDSFASPSLVEVVA